MRWELAIHIGDPKEADEYPPDNYTWDRALLRSDKPAGPAPMMLSNLRYSVIINKWDVSENKLYMSIVPRSRWGMQLKDTPDARFLLPMAHISPWAVPRGKRYPAAVELKSTMISQNSRRNDEQVFKHDEYLKLGAL